MKKLICILLSCFMIIGSAGCGSKDKGSDEEVNNKDKVYSLGDTVYIENNEGKKIYSFTINSVKNSPEFEFQKDFEPEQQIIEVSYTYDNIDGEGDINIHSQDLTVSDEKGAIAGYSSMFPKGKPVNAPVGTNNTVEGYYGLRNNSTKIKINFKSETYPKNNFTFECSIS